MEIIEDKYTYRHLDICHSHVSEKELDFYLNLCDNITFPLFLDLIVAFKNYCSGELESLVISINDLPS